MSRRGKGGEGRWAGKWESMESGEMGKSDCEEKGRMEENIE